MGRVALGYLDRFHPFVWTEKGVPRGMLPEALLQHMPKNTKIEWYPGDLVGLPDLLINHQIDGILGKAITPERQERFTFSQAFTETGAALFGTPGGRPPHPATAGTAKIATPGEGPLIAVLRALAPQAEVLPVADYDAAMSAVEQGIADWAALNADVTPTLFPERISEPGPRWAPLRLAVAVAPGDPQGVLERLGLTPG